MTCRRPVRRPQGQSSNDQREFRWIASCYRLAATLAFLPIHLISAASAGELGLGSDQLDALKRGEAIVTVRSAGSAGVVAAAIDIPVSPAVLWSAMLDCGRAARIVSGLSSCRVLERDPKGQWDVREHVVRWSWLMPSTRSVFRSVYEPPQRIRFNRVAGDLKSLDGEWVLQELPGGEATRVHYMATVDPGIPVPRPLLRAAIESDVPRTLKALRDEALSGTRRK